MHTTRFAPAQFPAAVVRSRVVGALTLSETRYGAESELARHAHEYACVVVVLEGTFHERFGTRERSGAPGTVIFRPEGEPHSDRFGRIGGRCLNVELPPQWMARIDAPAAFTSSLAGRRLQHELAHADDVTPLAVESIVLGLFADVVRESRRAAATPPRWLLATRARIHDEPAARLTLHELASAAGVHPVHLAATFRRFFGQTVAAYVRQSRVEHACRALAESDAPLADIALAAGFADQSHFGRTFKRLMRATPAEYRANVPRP